MASNLFIGGGNRLGTSTTRITGGTVPSIRQVGRSGMIVVNFNTSKGRLGIGPNRFLSTFRGFGTIFDQARYNHNGPTGHRVKRILVFFLGVSRNVRYSLGHLIFGLLHTTYARTFYRPHRLLRPLSFHGVTLIVRLISQRSHQVQTRVGRSRVFRYLSLPLLRGIGVVSTSYNAGFFGHLVNGFVYLITTIFRRFMGNEGVFFGLYSTLTGQSRFYFRGLVWMAFSFSITWATNLVTFLRVNGVFLIKIRGIGVDGSRISFGLAEVFGVGIVQIHMRQRSFLFRHVYVIERVSTIAG